MKTNIYNYLDYRRFLKDLTRELKSKRQYNVRRFARLAGIKTPGYMKMVVDGKRNLTMATADKFCRALDITGPKKRYFEKLVLYNQTTHPDLKKEYMEELLHLRPRATQYQLEKKQNHYFICHYYVCVQEMVALPDFQEDPKWIAQRCFPPIRPSQAKEALKTLLELGLLKRDETGRLIQTRKIIQVGNTHTDAAEAYHFHESAINLARHALGLIDQDKRNYQSITLPLSKKKYAEIVDKICSLRDAIAAADQEDFCQYDEIYQINFQVFPVTQKEG